MKKINPYSVLIALIVLAAVLTAISATVQTIDVNTVDPAIQPAWKALVFVFTTSAVTPLFTLVANLYGYVTNKLEAPSDQRDGIQYQANLVLATYLKIDGYTKGISAFVIALTVGTPMAPYAVYAAGAAAFVLDIAVRTVKKLAKPSTPVAPPAGSQP